MRHAWKVGVVLLGVLLLSSLAGARDFGVSLSPIHQGKFTSSLLYEHLKVTDDFGARGETEFTSHVAGAQFTYGVTDRLALALKGGALVDFKEEAQGTEWQGDAGYLYGLDFFNEVFPATEYRPGVMLNMGVTGFGAPFQSVVGSTTSINQRMTGIDYHGSVVVSMKWKRLQPYGGLKFYGRSINWRDNQPLPGQPGKIVGHSAGNMSVIVGVPVRITQDVQFHVEGTFIDQTAVTAGFTLAAF